MSDWLAVPLLLALAVLVRLPGLDHLPITPFADELYTALAARGWAADGVPSIGDGLYTRAYYYTALIGELYRLFGDSLVVARLPSLLAGSLLVVAVFLWTRSVAGTFAAWIAALFVAFSPLQIQASQFARFYALFGLLFWLGAIGIYSVCQRRLESRSTWLIAIAAVLALLASVHLQVIGLMALVGMAIWLALAVVLPRLPSNRVRILVGVGGAILGLVALVVFLQTGLGHDLLTQYRWAPEHSRAHANQVWFYHLTLIERYPSLWPVTAFAALIALAWRPQPTLFCLIIFATALALLSFGAMKDFLFLLFVMPFLFVVWAIALARIGPWLVGGVVEATDQASSQILPGFPPRPARWALVGIAVVFLILANGAPARTLLKPFGLSLDARGAPVDWADAKSTLEPWLDGDAVVLAGNDLPVLYYIGGYDVGVSANLASEVRGGEFDRDPRTGFPVISTPESVRLMIACFPTGLFVTDLRNWRSGTGVVPEVADLIEAETTPIEVPARGVRAFHWQHPEPLALKDGCEALRSELRP